MEDLVRKLAQIKQEKLQQEQVIQEIQQKLDELEQQKSKQEQIIQEEQKKLEKIQQEKLKQAKLKQEEENKLNQINQEQTKQERLIEAEKLKFDLHKYSGNFVNSSIIGSVTDDKKEVTLNKNPVLFGDGSSEYHHRDKRTIVGIEFVDLWKDGTNGTIEFRPVGSNNDEFIARCISQPFRGHSWKIIVYY